MWSLNESKFLSQSETNIFRFPPQEKKPKRCEAPRWIKLCTTFRYRLRLIEDDRRSYPTLLRAGPEPEEQAREPGRGVQSVLRLRLSSFSQEKGAPLQEEQPLFSPFNPHFNYCGAGDPQLLASENVFRGSQETCTACRKAHCLINTLFALQRLIFLLSTCCC